MSKINHSKPLKVYLAMILAAFFWAGAFIAGKLGIAALPPVLLTFFRMGIASLILFPIMIYRHPKTWKLKKKQIIPILATSIVGMIAYHLLFFSALKYTTASKAAMINACNPLITAFIASKVVHEKLTLRKIAFILMALFGVVYIMLTGDLGKLTAFDFNKGDLLMFTGTICWATYSVIVRLVIKDFGPIKLTAYSFLGSSLLLMPFALKSMLSMDLGAIGYSPYIAVVYMAIFPTVIGYAIQQYAIGEIGPSNTALFINLVPILSTVMAVIFLGEVIGLYHIVGALFIITAVIGFSTRKAPLNPK